MRLFLPIFASLALALNSATAMADGQIKYQLTTATTLNISEQDADSLSGDIVIPATYTVDGVECTVTTMAVSAFKGCESITSIDLSATAITTITYHTFAGCTNLKKVILPSTVTKIEGDAFGDCKSLESIDLPNGLTSIGEAAFSGCESLESLTIPGSISTLEASSLMNVSGLRYITIEDGVKYLSPSCLNGCTKLESVTLPETLTSISNDCFAGDVALKEITLPSGLQFIGNNAFSGCSSLSKVTYLGDATSFASLQIMKYAFYNNAEGIKLQVGSSIYKTALSSTSQWRTFEGSPWQSDESVSNISIIGELDTTFIVDNTTDWSTALSEISKNEAYASASVVVESPISFESTNVDLESLSHNNVGNYLDTLNMIENFAGKIDGNVISNAAYITTGIFGNIETGAKIDGLVLDNTLLYIDPRNTEQFIQESNGIKTVPILAKTCNGSVTNFGFSGSVVMDANLWGPEQVELCLVYDLEEDAELSGFFYVDDAVVTGDGSNKRCITIKQNLGVRNSKTAKIKMAMRKAERTNKSLADGELDYTDYSYSEAELNEMVRYFDDKEFASGVVALWLNYEGTGYSGEYTGRWRQGKTVPVAATKNADGTTNGVYPVVYANAEEASAKLLQMPHYANNGSPITLRYSEANRPAQIKVGDKDITPGKTSTTLTFNAKKPISILFGTGNTTSIDDKPANVTIKIAGRTATIYGAEGETKTLYSLTSKKVAETQGNALTAPAQGLYILRCGNKVTKIIMR